MMVQLIYYGQNNCAVEFDLPIFAIAMQIIAMKNNFFGLASTIDPYSGDLFHETPLCLEAFSLMQKFLTDTFLKLLFILTDFTTAWLIAMIARNYFTEVVRFQF